MQTKHATSLYEEAVSWITGLRSFGIKPGLKRMEYMMEKFGNPHRRLKFIHVAGTNGKGSTCAYLTKVLHEAGYDVGTFTSPYLERFTNRIQYNEQDIEENHLVELVNRVRPIAEQMAQTELGSPTMFEVSTTIAILYFATIQYPHFVVWETGMGGELDSTNIVYPIVSVITNIGYDHTDILGNDLKDIAQQKAGIIKSGVPVVSAANQPEVIEVIKAEANKKKATLYQEGETYSYELTSSKENEQIFQFQSPFQEIPNVQISMNGEHQVKNAALSLMTLEILRQYYAAIVEADDLYRAYEHTSWKGRLEMLEGTPRILLDGAHNVDGAQSLAKTLQHTYSWNQLHMMVGVLVGKEVKEYLRPLLPLVQSIVITEPSWMKKLEVSQLEQVVNELKQEMGLSVELIVEPDWKEATSRLRSLAAAEDLCVVTGSLYLVSDVRSWLLDRTESEKGW